MREKGQENGLRQMIENQVEIYSGEEGYKEPGRACCLFLHALGS